MSATRPTQDARAWIGEDPFPWPAVDALIEGERVSACYCVESKQLLLTKDEKPYLRLQLCDRSGSIEGRVWDDAAAVDARVAEGDYVGVRGRLNVFRGQRQLKVEEITPIAVAPEELELFLPRTPFDIDALEAELDRLAASIEDAPLRVLVERLTGKASETGRAYRRAPAAKKNHHAYVGGLLEHSVSLARNCDHMARHYGEMIDRDLLVAGALLHDIGKVREIRVSGGFPYTDEGKLLGHIVLGIEMVRDEAAHVPDLSEDRLLLLLHLIASHQGRYEWQSPKIPMLLEALILHYVDDLDAKMHQAMALVDSVEKGWTRFDASFAREFLRHRGVEAYDDAPPPLPAADTTRETRVPDDDPFDIVLDDEYDDIPYASVAELEAEIAEAEVAAPADTEAEVEDNMAAEDGRGDEPAEAPGRTQVPAESGRSGIAFSPETLDLFGG